MKDLSAFLDHFALPLVKGGELHIGGPVDEATAAHFCEQIDAGGGAAAERVDEARAQVIAELCVRPPPLVLGAIDLRLALTLYNALALAHPDTERFTARSAARARVLAVSLDLAAVPKATTRAEVLGRHGLLWQLPALSRTDLHVRWWTGRAEFRGQRPPRRLLAWPGVRGVHVDRDEVPIHELLGFEEGVALHAALLGASPLTDLATPERVAPGFAWGHAQVVLADVELARAVAHGWIAPGRAPAALPAAGAAWERLLAQTAPAAEVRAATAFLVHVGVLAAMDDASVALEAPGAALFWALPDVVLPVAPILAQPPGVADEARLAARWTARRERAVELLGAHRIAELRQQLAARLG
jgi:hypothetical protein